MKMLQIYTFDVPDFDDCGGRTMRRVEVPKAVFRQIEADVAAPLESVIHQLGENAAKAAAEYAGRVAVLEAALRGIANSENYVTADEMRIAADIALYHARAALTEPSDG